MFKTDESNLTNLTITKSQQEGSWSQEAIILKIIKTNKTDTRQIFSQFFLDSTKYTSFHSFKHKIKPEIKK